MCGLPLPLVATQILYLNIITNGLQDLALNFEKTENGILKESPRSTKESLFSKSLILECLISGFVIGAVVFGVWYTLMTSGADLVFARSIVMVLMVFIQNFHTFNCRSETKSIFQIPLNSNWFVWLTVVLAIALQIVIMEVPFLAHLISLTT
ncbi:MAG: cation transporting ATPase C-terminal domain-containing protein, partial [Clostridia bacterium]|nr:cation transporting ATPase C-terminal domain-containing protein [Clostridia bacterium]